MKILSILAIALMSQSVFASDFVTLNIDVKNKIDMIVVGVYQAQKNSFFCKKTTFTDGQMRRLPIVTDEVIRKTSSTGIFQIDIVKEKNDSCESRLRGIGVNLINTSLLFERNLSLVMQATDPKDVQKVLIGPSRYGSTVYYVTNTSEIKMGPSGEASISVEFVDYDPLPPRK